MLAEHNKKYLSFSFENFLSFSILFVIILIIYILNIQQKKTSYKLKITKMKFTIKPALRQHTNKKSKLYFSMTPTTKNLEKKYF